MGSWEDHSSNSISLPVFGKGQSTLNENKIQKRDPCINNMPNISRIHGSSLSDVKWNVVIIDEAHRLKNEKSNSIKHDPRTREHFRDFYDEPLKHGQRSTAPDRFVQIANKRKQHLVEVLRKYMLRRTKEETIGHLMMGKEDNIVFCAMSDLQKVIYKRMLQLPDISPMPYK
ncbi:hypothetical protein ACSQ67_025651 [Phaseolus vulgaris]